MTTELQKYPIQHQETMQIIKAKANLPKAYIQIQI